MTKINAGINKTVSNAAGSAVDKFEATLNPEIEGTVPRNRRYSTQK